LTAKELKIGLAVASVLLLVATLLYLCFWRSVDELGYGSSDASVVRLAQKEWALVNHVSERQVEERHYPSVVHFPTKTCVELRLRKGIAGLSPVYCFEGKTDRIVERYTEGE